MLSGTPARGATSASGPTTCCTTVADRDTERALHGRHDGDERRMLLDGSVRRQLGLDDVLQRREHADGVQHRHQRLLMGGHLQRERGRGDLLRRLDQPEPGELHERDRSGRRLLVGRRRRVRPQRDLDRLLHVGGESELHELHQRRGGRQRLSLDPGRMQRDDRRHHLLRCWDDEHERALHDVGQGNSRRLHLDRRVYPEAGGDDVLHRQEPPRRRPSARAPARA